MAEHERLPDVETVKRRPKTVRHNTIVTGTYRSFTPLAALVLVLWSFVNASAIMESQATTTLVENAECIVEGRVVNIGSRWTDDHSTIITEVVVETIDPIKGIATNQVTFQYPGGIVGDVGLRVSDMPTVTNGQHVLVFLRKLIDAEAKRDQKGSTSSGRKYSLLSAAQGLYQVANNRATKGGFSVVDDPKIIDHDIDVNLLKEQIRRHLRDLQSRNKTGDSSNIAEAP